MSRTNTPCDQVAGPQVEIAPSARVFGSLRMADGAYLAQGLVVRTLDDAVAIGAGSAVLENGTVVGRSGMPVSIGRRTVFGHRCTIVGAEVGDLCEVGNGATLLPGARLGDRVMLGEGTLVPPGAHLPADTVWVGRPARRLRDLGDADVERLTALRGGHLTVPDHPLLHHQPEERHAMGTLYAYKDRTPEIGEGTVLFDSAEVTGDVRIGRDCIIGAGVRIIGDSHGPVRIGDRVQILENTVLHLLPDNQLVIGDDCVIGPAAMIHGCVIGDGCVIEPAAIVSDWSTLGDHCRVAAGAVLVQGSTFPDHALITGCLAEQTGETDGPLPAPSWALTHEEVATLVRLPDTR